MAFKLVRCDVYVSFIISLIEVYCMTSSALITTALSVTRAIVTMNPFIKIKPKKFWSLMGCILLLNFVFIVPYTFSKPFLFDNDAMYKVTYWMLISMVALLFILTIIFGTITLSELSSDNQREHKHFSDTRKAAAITVLLLVTAFCVTNMGGYIFHILATADEIYHRDEFSIHTRKILHLCHDYMTTLNAVLNPMIYICRKRGIRVYVQNVLYKLRICNTKFEVEPTSNTQTPSAYPNK